MSQHEVRWIQRFQNFKKALNQLEKFVAKKDELNEMEQQGLIKAFEYTFELAWTVIKDFYEYQGITNLQGSRDAFRTGIERGLISNGEEWMNMIESRIKTVHTYNEETADEIASAIVSNYFPMFQSLKQSLEKFSTNI
ncbi:MAG: nucleotidyltransferase substrate binding protein [Chloroherpetonaceae bacterium]